MTPEQFKQALAQHQIELSEHQEQQFAAYFKLLVEYNEKVNLTTITNRDDVYLKHFYDSLTPAFYVSDLKEKKSLVDVGAGAGFPSIPLKIINPNLEVTIVDSLNKRIIFLQKLVELLGLEHVSLVHARAEEFGGRRSKDRASFDLATARALARLSVMSELCLPLVKIGGKLIAMKAAKAPEELAAAEKAIHVLGGQVVDDFEFKLPKNNEDRHIIVIEKERKTPIKYPRKAGTPNKEPIE
ncbi:16S rRNA (guanine(527)-N(7))-methyltransferase [Fructilactobacillus lindneri]|uniref:Ribosomal RNA small subunit methyltransferase G n=2 Tax=Fructilactobacillus lindneri TaxID=53444 RepID=A0A0R2JWA2_9LACO|nr:16S rRNA (guanine(527)-N(7))-methyltransferase RsmG [Fructilactobacillus lindneri]ANZ57383.1 16S rRNA methyltransferase G [Fructilactobacillus lindneri]ANZ58648.1 16S rRNA methyltransferase G [Fructilactobacillus lindneri]KRN79990.1 ribosomal RNA small subunit methyltransferase G [Fructilactobacillus lindneri DSM 20690 = JCM 11027]POG97868.1 16S rRNA (guanine(527)-N(7))-methyltransferase [Fructilactobacillus lindneri]POG99200.1 16S rRNA (guanine(527)-N(7))-methyltransferase [Fructilactobaci